MSNDADFVIRFGPQFFMDSAGRFVDTAVVDKAIIDLGREVLPAVDPEAVRKALTSVIVSLPDLPSLATLPSFEQVVPEQVVSVLGDVCSIAGKLAKAVPYVGAVVQVVELFADLFSSPSSTGSPLLAEIRKLFDETNNLILASQMDWLGIARSTYATVVNDALAHAEFCVKLAKSTPGPDPVELDKALQLLRTRHEEAREALAGILNPTVWKSIFYASELDRVWSDKLVAETSSGSVIPVSPLPTQEARFDHRAMVPIVCALTQSYLTVLKTMQREYRSIGNQSRILSDRAAMIDVLAAKMRDENLLRTHWSANDFGFLWSDQPKTFGPDLKGFHVGAVDRCSRVGDVPPLPPSSFGWVWDMSGAKVDYGLMHFNWKPPVQPRYFAEVYGRHLWEVLNPDECADAANALSREQYGVLLASSGYLALVQLAGLLRHLATPPDTSETVEGIAYPYRREVGRRRVPVSGRKVFPLPTVTATAWRYDQSCVVDARVTTQPLTSDVLFPYRVVLRTLHARRNGTSDYADIYRTSYTEPANELQIDFNASGVVSQQVLVSSKSPKTPKRTPSTELVLQADTFDWFIPVPDLAPPSRVANDLRQTGWLTPVAHTADGSAASSSVPSNSSPLPGNWAATAFLAADKAAASFGLTSSGEMVRAPSLSPEPVGERRNVRREQVRLTYSLVWDGIDLNVIVEGNPADRNFDLFLVLEEKILSGTGKHVLHTPFLLPVTNQLTFVPQSFFRAEQDAIEQARRFWQDFNRHYSRSEEPNPLDPIQRLGWRDMQSAEGLIRTAHVARSHRPDLVAAFAESYRFKTQPKARSSPPVGRAARSRR